MNDILKILACEDNYKDDFKSEDTVVLSSPYFNINDSSFTGLSCDDHDFTDITGYHSEETISIQQEGESIYVGSDLLKNTPSGSQQVVINIQGNVAKFNNSVRVLMSSINNQDLMFIGSSLVNYLNSLSVPPVLKRSKWGSI